MRYFAGMTQSGNRRGDRPPRAHRATRLGKSALVPPRGARAFRAARPLVSRIRNTLPSFSDVRPEGKARFALRASVASERRERSAPTKRRARERVQGASEGEPSGNIRIGRREIPSMGPSVDAAEPAARRGARPAPGRSRALAREPWPGRRAAQGACPRAARSSVVGSGVGIPRIDPVIH